MLRTIYACAGTAAICFALTATTGFASGDSAADEQAAEDLS